jgi:hypothetical protein
MQVTYSHEVETETGKAKFYHEVNAEDKLNPFVVIKRYDRNGFICAILGYDSFAENVFNWSRSKTSVRKFNNGCGRISNPDNVLEKEGIEIINID